MSQCGHYIIDSSRHDHISEVLRGKLHDTVPHRIEFKVLDAQQAMLYRSGTLFIAPLKHLQCPSASSLLILSITWQVNTSLKVPCFTDGSTHRVISISMQDDAATSHLYQTAPSTYHEISPKLNNILNSCFAYTVQ